MGKRHGVSGLLVCALLSCGGKGQRADGAAGAGGLLGAAGAADATGAGGTGGAAAGGSGGSTGGGGGTGGLPAPTMLQGGWYAVGTVADAGFDTVTHKRIRFDGNRYVVVYNTRLAYCAEVGTFQITAAGLEFTFEQMLGLGQVGPPCLQGTSHTERLSGAVSGFTLDFQGVVTSYARIRDNVPKMFATIERHDGAFGSDTTLAGNDPIAKADDFCDKSVAKPDGGRYRAILWDDVNRSAPPSATWFLPPKTTYFQADGVRNMFTTDADGYGNALQPAISDSESVYFWVGGGCNGWTSALMTVGASMANAGQPDWISANVLSGCNVRVGIYCASEVGPAGGGADGGVDAGSSGGADAGTLGLAGSWRRTDTNLDAERLRFDSDTYYLVWDEYAAYCAETGTFAAADPTGVRFMPAREEGFGGRCLMRDDHVETLTVTAAGITLSRAGVDAHYVRAAENVPKIFVTPEMHHGDFLHDAHLAGANAIAKADAFCNGSVAKPDGRLYKAILVDGTNRNPLPAVDWVIKPNTTYYQAAGVRPIFMSDARGLYDNTVLPLGHFLPNFSVFVYLWTGVDGYFTAGERTCQGWTSSSDMDWGAGVDAGQGDWAGGLGGQCSYRNRGLLCASQ